MRYAFDGEDWGAAEPEGAEGFEHGLTFVLESSEEGGDLGKVRIEAEGGFDIDPASVFPPKWNLIIKADLTVPFYDPPASWRDAGEAEGPLVLRSAEPMKFTGTLNSLSPEKFTVEGGKAVLKPVEGGPEMFGSLPIVGGMMGGGGGGGGLPLPM